MYGPITDGDRFSEALIPLPAAANEAHAIFGYLHILLSAGYDFRYDPQSTYVQLVFIVHIRKHIFVVPLNQTGSKLFKRRARHMLLAADSLS